MKVLVKDTDGRMALYEVKFEAVVDKLLMMDCGADLLLEVDYQGRIALYWAATKGSWELVQALLNKWPPGKVDSKDKAGCTAIFRAA